jgi:hypothetical protein
MVDRVFLGLLRFARNDGWQGLLRFGWRLSQHLMMLTHRWCSLKLLQLGRLALRWCHVMSLQLVATTKLPSLRVDAARQGCRSVAI